MRVFISINFSEKIKKQIEEIQNSLPEFEGNKTKKENLHLTLKFLGNIDEKTVEKVKERLRQVKLNKFEAEIGRLGVFSRSFVKIIWLHIKNCDELQSEIDNALLGLFEKEKRFMGHLTIARVKKISNKKEFFGKILKIKPKKIKFVVDKFYLVESKLSKTGPTYCFLDEFPLK